MTEFINLSEEKPFQIIQEKYNLALSSKQQAIEAFSISSYNRTKEEISSRFVNLKYIKDDKFIFFTNYHSPKYFDIKSNNQVAALIYWSSINIQIRIKGLAQKTSYSFNNEYFKNRSKSKNALAISSNQSKEISSYEEVQRKYNSAIEKEDLTRCPNYWGGISIDSYEIEFWEGERHRLNKRDLYKKINNNSWIHSILEP